MISIRFPWLFLESKRIDSAIKAMKDKWMILFSLAVQGALWIHWLWIVVVYFLIHQIILGRFPCCFEFCGSYGGASYIFLSEQRLGYQYPYFRPVSKYSSFSCALFYLKIPFTVFLNGYINLFVVLFHWQVTVLLLKALLMEFEVFE